jgi:endonuclease-8
MAGMAEGDTILRAARRIDAALAGEQIAVAAPNPRGRAAGIERLDGRRLDRAEARGKHLLLHFGDLVLHSHLGMSGGWHVHRRGAAWRRPRASAWAVLTGIEQEAVQFGGPTLRVLPAARLRRLGEALLDQSLVAGIGNIFKSEACFAARVDPWRPLGELTEAELGAVLGAAREEMLDAVARGDRHAFAVYRRRGPCGVCGGRISSRGQGDANRTTYWCPSCQG